MGLGEVERKAVSLVFGEESTRGEVDEPGVKMELGSFLFRKFGELIALSAAIAGGDDGLVFWGEMAALVEDVDEWQTGVRKAEIER